MKAGWNTKPLGELCDVIGGGTPPKDRPDYYGGDIPWATVRDMRTDIITSTEHSITAEAVKASATNIIPAGTRKAEHWICILRRFRSKLVSTISLKKTALLLSLLPELVQGDF